MRLRLTVFHRMPRNSITPLLAVEAALLLAHALAIGDRRMAKWVGDRLIDGLSDGSMMGAETMSFEPFMMRVHARWTKREIDWTKHKLGPLGVYRPVLNAWEDSAKLGKALADALDYHVRHSDLRSDEEGPQFCSSPYADYPCEVVGLLRVRKEQGLEDCVVDHPLMDSPFAKPPASPPVVKEDDPLIDEVRQRAAEHFGDSLLGPKAPEKEESVGHEGGEGRTTSS
jgi:hypothetical protein